MYAGQQTTQLEELTDHGFKAADITSVLVHGGGSKNIEALLFISPEINGMLNNFLVTN